MNKIEVDLQKENKSTNNDISKIKRKKRKKEKERKKSEMKQKLDSMNKSVLKDIGDFRNQLKNKDENMRRRKNYLSAKRSKC